MNFVKQQRYLASKQVCQEVSQVGDWRSGVRLAHRTQHGDGEEWWASPRQSYVRCAAFTSLGSFLVLVLVLSDGGVQELTVKACFCPGGALL